MRFNKYSLESGEFLHFQTEDSESHIVQSSSESRPRCVEKLQNALDRSKGESNSSLREEEFDEQSERPRVVVRANS